MTKPLQTLLALACIGFCAQASAQATFYEDNGYSGRPLRVSGQLSQFDSNRFNDRSSSIVVVGQRWEVCEDEGFQGHCLVLRPGRYPALSELGLNDRISSARALATQAKVPDTRYAPLPGVAQVTFFETERFGGDAFSTTGAIANFQRYGFNNSASSAAVAGGRWEVCDNSQYRGRCVVLRPGRYPSLASMGLNDRISSVRAVAATQRVRDDRFAPAPVARYDSRRRGGERLYEAEVGSARAVLATSGQRCWVEREQVQGYGNQVPAGLAGALIGGILGHQVGGGSGKDIATIGGVIAGAAIGAQLGRDGSTTQQDVQRCETLPGGAQPAFWDVSYNFRGVDHRVQMGTAPGRTLTVNERGEPRE